eukprot:3933197-Rhodomonas_salina.3
MSTRTGLLQLKKDERILGFFYLHHEKKKTWMLKYWAGSYATKQPHEDIRSHAPPALDTVVRYPQNTSSQTKTSKTNTRDASKHKRLNAGWDQPHRCCTQTV